MKSRLLLFLSLIILSASVKAQVSDNFSDGDFSLNPAWSGSGTKFTVNAAKQLQLNGIAANDTAYLNLPNTLINNTEWKIWIRTAFKGSTSNYVKIYLAADNANFKSQNLNGYYLRIGKTGNLDGVDLYRQTGKTSTLINAGGPGRAAKTNNIISVKVQRDNMGNWTVFSDTTGGVNYVQEGQTVLDNTHTTTGYFGMSCRYSSANKAKFYFDDISVSQYVNDTVPPKLDSVAVTDQTHLYAYFSEPVDAVSAENTDNYFVTNGLGKPIDALRDAADLRKVRLEFGSNFTGNLPNTLTATSITDNAGNIISAGNKAVFTYRAPIVALLYDIIITEIFADPSPRVSLLPEKEFVEIYNRSAKIIDLSGFQFTDGSSVAKFTGKTIAPGNYLILCANADTNEFKPFGNTLGLTSFPSLNNTGDDLKLLSKTGDIVDQVNYSDDWYRDEQKKEGGYSLERIDPDFTCPDAAGLNWLASKSSAAGSPGIVNSVIGKYADNIAPELLSAFAINDTTISLIFSETVDNTALHNSLQYSISNNAGFPKSILVNNDTVIITLAASLSANITYTITLSDTLADCSGNRIGKNNVARFALIQPVAPFDVVVNEILFNPRTGGVDFVEIYNRSKKVLDLKTLQISNTETKYPISKEHGNLFPGEYRAITSSPSILKSHYANTQTVNCIKVPSTPSFNDDEGTVLISNLSNEVIDRFGYSEKMHFALLNDNEGVSLERISTQNIVQNASNWHSAAEAAGFATPGFKNSQALDINPGTKKISIEPEIFSPDNDGFNDILTIHYNFKTVGLLGSVTLYDAKGNQVKHLAKNELIGLEGNYTWDGISDSGEKARIGLYIVYFETTDTQGGIVDAEKISCVLGAKL